MLCESEDNLRCESEVNLRCEREVNLRCESEVNLRLQCNKLSTAQKPEPCFDQSSLSYITFYFLND